MQACAASGSSPVFEGFHNKKEVRGCSQEQMLIKLMKIVQRLRAHKNA